MLSLCVHQEFVRRAANWLFKDSVIALACQLDFDGIDLDEEEGFEEAGVHGVVYIFLRDGEVSTAWQYT